MRNGAQRWTAVEHSLLRRMYPDGDLDKLAGMLVGRTRNAMFKEASRLGLVRVKNTEPLYPVANPELWRVFVGWRAASPAQLSWRV